MTDESRTDSDQGTYRRGLDLLRKGRVEEGIELLRSISPRMPLALGDIAWAHRVRGELETALECLEQFVEHFPGNAGAWTIMAQIARERNDADGARTYARKAADTRPRDARTWFELGEIFLSTQDWDRAADAFGECLKIDPRMGRASVRRQFALRCGGSGLVRFLRKWLPRRLVPDGLFASNLLGTLIEIDMGIVLNDRRWTLPLDWGSPAGRAPKPNVEPGAGNRHPATGFRKWFDSLRLVGPIKRVLEIGFGPGETAAFLAAKGYAVVSATASEFARRDRERRGIDALRTNIHLIEKPGESFDLIVDDFSLHHSRAALLALWEWKRLLRPDGYLVIAAHLAVDGAPSAGRDAAMHYTFGVPGRIMTLTYWQLRWLIKQADFQLLAETLEDPASNRLEGVEHVDGRRLADPARAWNVFFLLRKPGRLPYDGALEKPRPPAARP